MHASVSRQAITVNTSELIYDWNQMDAAKLRPTGPVLLNDESLRDGLQSPSVRDPSIAEKIQILHLMEALGINSLDLGLPGAGPRALADCEALAHEIVRHKLKIRANCAARTVVADIRPIVEISQRYNSLALPQKDDQRAPAIYVNGRRRSSCRAPAPEDSFARR